MSVDSGSSSGGRNGWGARGGLWWAVLRRLAVSALLLGTNVLPAAGEPAGPPSVSAPPAAELATALGGDDSDAKIAAIESLLARGDDATRRVLPALADDTLHVAAGRLLIKTGETWTDGLTGVAVKDPEGPESVGINNRVRRVLEQTQSLLALLNPDPETRRKAAQALQDGLLPAGLALVERALAEEKDAGIRELLTLARAQAKLRDPDAAVRRQAVEALGGSSSPQVKPLLQALLEKQGDSHAEPDEAVRRAAQDALRAIDRRSAQAEAVGRVFSGLSLGSILLLAALGLAITYGVMGVINMAHGELLMVGAYCAWLTQGLFRRYWPEGIEYYLLAAVPLAFVVAALVGAVIERLVIRHLYGRPLESLLATWGLSLVLIQAARVIFGPQNVEVANPAWMAGGVTLWANVVLPWNRIVIIGFAVGVLALVWLLLQKTRLGLFVRAVTQNRAMAGCVGVPTARVDTLAFALGAGIAGLGGVALSQVSNVGPDMGQGYIVDSFLVVVLGGVGQLAGAVWAALGLGVMAKFLEGWTGAVIAKILVLVFIIIFIQKRPQGLFALKGRFVEA